MTDVSTKVGLGLTRDGRRGISDTPTPGTENEWGPRTRGPCHRTCFMRSGTSHRFSDTPYLSQDTVGALGEGLSKGRGVNNRDGTTSVVEEP